MYLETYKKSDRKKNMKSDRKNAKKSAEATPGGPCPHELVINLSRPLDGVKSPAGEVDHPASRAGHQAHHALPHSCGVQREYRRVHC